VKTYLVARPNFVVTDSSIGEIGEDLGIVVCHFLSTWQEPAPELACCLVVCQADPGNSGLLVGSITLTFDSNLDAGIRNIKVIRHEQSDVAVPELFGQGAYVAEHVQNGVGRRFMSPDDYSLWSSRPFIRDLSSDRAARLAGSIIRAAGKTSDIIPTPGRYGIGGPVTIVLATASGALPIEFNTAM
jgi:hypothetical protein